MGGWEFPLASAAEEQPKRRISVPSSGWPRTSSGSRSIRYSSRSGTNWRSGELRFKYGWQAKYDVTEPLARAGDVRRDEGLANAGPLDQQLHSIGRAFCYTFEEEMGERRRRVKPRAVGKPRRAIRIDRSNLRRRLKVFIGYEFITPLTTGSACMTRPQTE